MKWIFGLLTTCPRIYRWRKFSFVPPRYEGGNNWFGMRIGPLWFEWKWGKK